MGLNISKPVKVMYPVQGWRYTGDGTRPWGLDDLEIGVEKFTSKVTLLSDPEGNCHETLRDLFREFRLRACRCDRQTDQLLHLQRGLRALAIKMHRKDQTFMADDILDDSRSYMEEYMYMLELPGFVTCSGDKMADVELSREVRAVLHMLDINDHGSNIDTSPAAILRMRRENSIPMR